MATHERLRTYQRDVRPLIERHCASCHTKGGIGPRAFDYVASEWAAGPPVWSGAVVSAVESGIMPPWMPDDGCRTLADERRLSADEIETFAGWARQGFLSGNEGEYRPPPRAEEQALGEPTLTVAPARPYQPDISQPDDYRCFVLPYEFTEESYVGVTDIQPGIPALAHHATLYALPPGVEPPSETAGAPGYPCFGGPGVDDAPAIANWEPGQMPSRAPEGAAIVLSAGSRLLMQVHYSTIHAHDLVAALEDVTRVHLWLLARGQKPSMRLVMKLLADRDLFVPAGAAHVTQQKTFLLQTAGTLVGLMPHMHELGRSIDLSIQRKSGENDCLIRIPAWDGHWQEGYRFAPDAFLPILPGDSIALQCVYDNSAANQPIVGGKKQKPRDVRYGDSALDEMCQAFVDVLEPF